MHRDWRLTWCDAWPFASVQIWWFKIHGERIPRKRKRKLRETPHLGTNLLVRRGSSSLPSLPSPSRLLPLSSLSRSVLFSSRSLSCLLRCDLSRKSMIQSGTSRPWRTYLAASIVFPSELRPRMRVERSSMMDFFPLECSDFLGFECLVLGLGAVPVAALDAVLAWDTSDPSQSRREKMWF